MTHSADCGDVYGLDVHGAVRSLPMPLSDAEITTFKAVAKGALMNTLGSPKAIALRHDHLARYGLALVDDLTALRTELAELKARCCETCTHHWGHEETAEFGVWIIECSLLGFTVPTDDFYCAAWLDEEEESEVV
jgi:hypothetical protein